jgi:hypothetical protein
MARQKIGYKAGRAAGTATRTVVVAPVQAATNKASNVTVGSSNAQGIIITSALVVFGLGFLNSYIVPRNTSRIRLFMGVGLLYIGLSVVSEFNESLARAFAILIMLTALLSEGGGVMNYLMGRGTHDSLNVFGGGTGTPNLPPVSTAIIPKVGSVTIPQQVAPGTRLGTIQGHGIATN